VINSPEPREDNREPTEFDVIVERAANEVIRARAIARNEAKIQREKERGVRIGWHKKSRGKPLNA
jgi:hypothetical protein